MALISPIQAPAPPAASLLGYELNSGSDNTVTVIPVLSPYDPALGTGRATVTIPVNSKVLTFQSNGLFFTSLGPTEIVYLGLDTITFDCTMSITFASSSAERQYAFMFQINEVWDPESVYRNQSRGANDFQTISASRFLTLNTNDRLSVAIGCFITTISMQIRNFSVQLVGM